MSDVGQLERKAQERVVKLFSDQLGYEYLGNWEYRDGNSRDLHPKKLFGLRKYSNIVLKRGITTNRNKFVLGPSGSGKSFFMNHLVRQYYEQLVSMANTTYGEQALFAGQKTDTEAYTMDLGLTSNDTAFDAALGAGENDVGHGSTSYLFELKAESPAGGVAERRWRLYRK